MTFPCHFLSKYSISQASAYWKYICCSQEIEERYGESTKLSQKMSGSFYEIFSRVMKVFVGKKVTIPGSFKRYAL